MQQSNHETNTYQENEIEIDLRAFFNSLVSKKFLILGLTAFITILAVLFTNTFTTTYQANISFSSASPNSLANINKLIYTDETKLSIFSTFLATLSSEKLQKDVFLENDFLTKFNKDNHPIDDVNGFIEGAINSIRIINPMNTKKDLELYLNEKPYQILINGVDPEAISNYLTILFEQDDSKNIMKIVELNKQKISIRLDQIEIEIEMLLKKSKQHRLNQINRILEEDGQKLREINDIIFRARFDAKERRLNEIEALTASATLAKSLGIIENNFKMINNDKSNSDFTIAISDKTNLPEWYLYGEKALLQRITILASRTNDDPFIPELIALKNQINEIQNNNLLKTLEARQDDSPFIPELITLNLEKDKLKSTDLNLSNTSSINMLASAKLTPTARNKNAFILLAFFVSLMLSILLVLIMYLLKPNEKTHA